MSKLVVSIWLTFWIVSSFFLRCCLSCSLKLSDWTLVLRVCSTVLAVGMPKWGTSFSETHFTPSFTYNIQNTSASVLVCSDMCMCFSIWGNTMCPVLQTFGLWNFAFIQIIKYKYKKSNMVYKLYHRQPHSCTQYFTLKTENLVSYHDTKHINIRSTRQKELK